MKVFFEVSTWDNTKNEAVTKFFICEVSKAKHEKLKAFAGRSKAPYWFEGLTGANWYRGGWYPLANGFINASNKLANNVQGVVIDDDVYLLREIRDVKPNDIQEA